MPAKGWRKDEQESNLDTVLLNEHLSIDNFLFPKATINKICKQALAQANDGNNYLFAKDTQTAIQRSSILFVNFIYHHAKQLVKNQNRKVVNADDILNALVQVGFGNFVDILNVELEKFNQRKESKKLARLKAKTTSSRTEIIDDDEDDNDIEDETEQVDKNKRVKLDVDDTMSDADSSVHRAAAPTNTTEEHEVEVIEDEEEEHHDDDEEEEVEEIRHAPSQLELEQRELAGDEAADAPKEDNEDEENDD